MSEGQAELMKKTVPGVDCDNDDDDDDDSNEDDDNNDTDDSPSDDYWKCLKENGSSEKQCNDAGCAWCETKAGYGICLDEEAAKSASESDWFTCDISLHFKDEEEIVNDPMDPTCIYATLQGEEGCKVTTDGDGNTCEWCSVSGAEICLDADQASIAEQVGGDCGGRAVEGKEEVVNDPFDASCLLATLQGKDSCNVATDGDGNSCEWCTVQGNPICLSSEQAEVAEQVGAICGESTVLSMQ